MTTVKIKTRTVRGSNYRLTSVHNKSDNVTESSDEVDFSIPSYSVCKKIKSSVKRTKNKLKSEKKTSNLELLLGEGEVHMKKK